FQFWAAGFLPWLAAVSWWPWMLLAAERLAHPEAALGRALALGSATLAAQLLAGHPEPTLYGATFAGFWLVTRQAGLPLRRPLLALLKAVPPFHLVRMPTKFFLITELAVICLAALGLGRLASGGRRLRTGMAVALALVAVGERAAQSVLRFRAYEEVTAAGEPLAARMQLLADYLVPWARL